MGESGSIYKPDKSLAAYHERKYKVFLEMLKDQEKYNEIMSWIKQAISDNVYQLFEPETRVTFILYQFKMRQRKLVWDNENKNI